MTGGGEGKRNILVIGGGFAGFVVARHCKKHFNVTLIDAKEYFEYTPGILRAYVKPEHLQELTFKYQPVFDGMGVHFIWGEVKKLDGEKRTCEYKTMHKETTDTCTFDYCVVAAGCNFGMFHPKGESLWFPSVWEDTRAVSSWKQHDERYWDGRLAHIVEEYEKVKALDKKKGSVLIVGAGFIGVEWATEIKYFFPNIEITICDMLPKCLGPLPDRAKDYCQRYMDANNIKSVYKAKFNPNNPDYSALGLTKTPDITYIATGFKASVWFMPIECMTQYSGTAKDGIEPDPKKKGPAGGGWIRTNTYLQVMKQDKSGNNVVYGADEKGFGRIYAVGDCNMLADLKPIPKISYPGEEQAAVACRQIEVIEKAYYGGQSAGWTNKPREWPCIPCYGELKMTEAWWPWGAGMFATSLGVDDACFVIAATHEPGSGYMVVWGYLCSWQKWYIEWSKVDQCKEGWIGFFTWWIVH